jgi:uncharacterized membrane protein YkgB
MKHIISKYAHSECDIHILRFSVIFVFALFGTYKWFPFEIAALEPILSNTWLKILYSLFGHNGASYFLGVAETATFLALIIGYKFPKFGIFGAIMTIVTGLTTLSLLPQLGKIDSFIIKDILLVGAGAVLLKYDLRRAFNI